MFTKFGFCLEIRRHEKLHNEYSESFLNYNFKTNSESSLEIKNPIINSESFLEIKKEILTPKPRTVLETKEKKIYLIQVLFLEIKK